MTSVLTNSARDTTLIPFSLWTTDSAVASALAKAHLPNLRAWLAQAQCVDVHEDRVQEPLLATLCLSHERAWAQVAGWPVVDGCLPWAAHAAHAQGLSGNGWAFITLCNWHVSNGQVTLGDPAHLQLDEATDAELFKAMHKFFLEDGIVLHPYKLGQWLAQSPLLVDVPTASLDRVIGRNIDPWLVGCDSMPDSLGASAQLLRRLQNEMQMFLYTHSINDDRRLSINSFWIHGTGTLTNQTNSEPEVVNTLRQSALQQDFIGWLEGWQHVDTHVIGPVLERLSAGEPQRLVLSGEHEFHVYDSAKPSLWQRVRTRIAPTSLDTVLGVSPKKD